MKCSKGDNLVREVTALLAAIAIFFKYITFAKKM